MDRTVPRGAAILLDFIRETEVGRKDAESYNVIYANKQHKLAKPLTEMTLAEVQAQQPSWSRNHGSSAAGGYQFMRATLKGLIDELGLRPTQKLDADLQDRLGYHLLKRRGYDEFMAGQISRTAFGKRLAQEWASFPVLAATQGAHLSLKRGQSYYSGDELNKALVSPSEVETIIDLAKAAGNETPIPTPKPLDSDNPPSPSPAPTGNAGKVAAGGVVMGILAVLTMAWERIETFLSNLF